MAMSLSPVFGPPCIQTAALDDAVIIRIGVLLRLGIMFPVVRSFVRPCACVRLRVRTQFRAEAFLQTSFWLVVDF